MAEEEEDPEARTQVPVFQALQADDPARLGEYVLVARLGAGGMGTVYLSHTRAGRPVAIKAIRPELADDPNFRRRFRHEVAAAGRVHGLYTAPVIDSEIDVAPLWLATAFVQGPTLSAAVSRHGALPVPSVLLLAAGVAEALQAVHGAGIVHRDLKASNVLLASDGPRVIDFGIAHAADATDLTHTGIAVGTPTFMSPEQAQNQNVGPATDVFSLGQLITYAAKGTPAFGEGQTYGVLYRIVHEEPDLTDVPAPLLPLLNRCLAKDPDERPSPTEVIDMCRAASEDGMLRRTDSWLPDALTADLTRHRDVPSQAPTGPGPLTYSAAPGSSGQPTGDGAAEFAPGPNASVDTSRDTPRPVRKGIRRRAVLAFGITALAGAGGTAAAIGLKNDSETKNPESGARKSTYAASKMLTVRTTATLTAPKDEEFFAAVFSPDSRTLATCSNEKVHLWNVGSRKIITTLAGPRSWSSAPVAFSQDGKKLVTGSEDNAVRLWNAETGRTYVTLTGHKDSVWSVAFSPDGTTLATCSTDATARLWNAKTGESTATLTRHKESVRAVAFSPDGKTLATGGEDGTAHLWNVKTGRSRTLLSKPGEFITSLEFSPDGKTVAAGGTEGVRLVDTETSETRALLTDHKNFVESVSFSSDGKILATGSRDGSVRLWEASGDARLSAARADT